MLRVSASQVKLRRSLSSKRTEIESLSKFCLCTHCDTINVTKEAQGSMSDTKGHVIPRCCIKYHFLNCCGQQNFQPIYLPLNAIISQYIGCSECTSGCKSSRIPLIYYTNIFQPIYLPLKAIISQYIGSSECTSGCKSSKITLQSQI